MEVADLRLAVSCVVARLHAQVNELSLQLLSPRLISHVVFYLLGRGSGLANYHHILSDYSCNLLGDRGPLVYRHHKLAAHRSW